MAIKHVRQYYNQVCDQYLSLQKEIQELQEEAEKGLIEPERIDQMKAFIEPLKNNYMTLSWIMYLLNMPNRKEKQKAYQKRLDKFTKNLNANFDKESIVKENQKIIEGVNH